MQRRSLILGLGALPLLTAPSASARADVRAPVFSALLAESPLIYLTPIQSNGTESRCQAEIWFVAEGNSAIVCTAADAWRSRAVQRGLTRTRVWVGDAGVWRRRGAPYKKLPTSLATASIVSDPDAQDRSLRAFSEKYQREWGVWGPRFKRGIAEGTRIILRYDLTPYSNS